MEDNSGLLERTVPFSVIELHFSYGNTPVIILLDSSESHTPYGGSDAKTIPLIPQIHQTNHYQAETTPAPVDEISSACKENASPAARCNSATSLGSPVCNTNTVGPAPEMNAATPAARNIVTKANDFGIASFRYF